MLVAKHPQTVSEPFATYGRIYALKPKLGGCLAAPIITYYLLFGAQISS